MRNLLLAFLLLLVAETAALACSCAAPGTPAEARASAREALRRAVAIVEVDVLSGYDRSLRRGEQVRVRRVLAGRAPRGFQVLRQSEPSDAACDLELTAGQRRVLIVYPAGRTLFSGPRYGIHNLCNDFLTRRPYLAMTLRQARHLRR